ncbi:MAG: class I SAM-dependent methyltransferase [Ardenticatenaceae bacterium]|nr:class I SAM-dependent methyltransferase [Ardenticatenaceae bacterium]HBY99314.1 class I SAM-dependent methyltransferase [Chloroflexota bacterium]
MRTPSDAAARLGEPSYVWRFGQDRRLAMIARWGRLAAARAVIDIGTGVGMYLEQLARDAPLAVGTEYDFARARQAAELGLVGVAAAERLPFPDGSFDLALSHEVLEHVQDDRAAMAEMVRVLRPEGRAVIFVPNRLWLFETHGIFWRGQYHFGNIPLVNYLPDPVRDRLAPHVRAYTARGLRDLLAGLPVTVVHHSQIFPGYDNLARRRPTAGRAARAITYLLEQSPARILGLSHLLVVEKAA